MTVTTCILANLIGICVFLGMKWLQDRIAHSPRSAPLIPSRYERRYNDDPRSAGPPPRKPRIVGMAADGTILEQLPDGRIAPARLTSHNCPRCGGNPKTKFCGHCGTKRYDPPKDAPEPYAHRTVVTFPKFGPPIVRHTAAPAEWFTESFGPR